MKRPLVALFSLVVLSVMIAAPDITAYAQPSAQKIPVSQGPLKQVNAYFRTQATTYSDGTVLERADILGPPKPPPATSHAQRPRSLRPCRKWGSTH